MSHRKGTGVLTPRSWFNLAGHHLLTLYLRELSIVARKLGPAELALAIRPGRGHCVLRGESPGRESLGSIVVSPWSGVVSLSVAEGYGSGLDEGTSNTGGG